MKSGYVILSWKERLLCKWKKNHWLAMIGVKVGLEESSPLWFLPEKLNKSCSN